MLIHFPIMTEDEGESESIINLATEPLLLAYVCV